MRRVVGLGRESCVLVAERRGALPTEATSPTTHDSRFTTAKGSMADTSQRRRFLQCPRCGAENLPTSKFCAQCGMNLRGEVQAPAATSMAPKGGAVLPYMPGQRGPGRTAQLALVFFAFVLLACL